MREIKFRAWDIESPCMLSWEDIQEQWQDHGYHPAIFQNDHYHCMQFTGLKDSKGVDIYEGDILKFKDHEGLRINNAKEEIKNWPNIGVVLWDSGWSGNPDAKFNCSDISGGNQPSWWMCNTKQVIGNIYENPDLLSK